jgi:competence protein ComEA
MWKTIKTYKIYILGVLLVFIVVFLNLLDQSENPVIVTENIQQPTVVDTNSLLVVHITGEVNQPGVYTLSENARLYEVVLMAGGLTAYANEQGINLSKQIEDEAFIYIPRIGEEVVDKPVTVDDELDVLININQASKTLLMTLPGIGETTADAIILYIEENGYFDVIEDIMNVSGIGEATFEAIKDLITI